MESEDLDERLQKESQRIAVAFGAISFEREPQLFYGPQALGITKDVSRWVSPPKHDALQVSFHASIGETYLQWRLSKSAQLCFLSLGHEERFETASVFFDSQCSASSVHPHPLYNHALACGLYRLGLDNDALFAQLNFPLSAHENLELRQNFPRDFWPQQWLDDAK